MNRLAPLWEGGRSMLDRTRMPRLTLALMGFRATSKASSVMLKSVSRTGRTLALLQTNRVSGASTGAISRVPPEARSLLAWTCALGGYTTVSKAASSGASPSCTVRWFRAGNSSWSVASISASSLMVSTGGPFSRSASSLSPPSGPAPWTWSVRVSVSGLYCRTTTRCRADVSGSSRTIPPFNTRGVPGKVLISQQPPDEPAPDQPHEAADHRARDSAGQEPDQSARAGPREGPQDRVALHGRLGLWLLV